jgi:hypothetical protein
MTCALCGKHADGKYGYRVAEMRHVCCVDCLGLSAADVRARLVARHVPLTKPASIVRQGAWTQRAPRCRAIGGCLLMRHHRGNCYLGESSDE